ncbi:sugar kinase [Tropicibacter oceani]|uniref:Sugar kinase n=1 Tax=Tropicibacter oceani TaxID=3058420 RepID=A0ABY8QPU7_9RHOB|nr:sugar kinase [Tropicibacter oceani]WGW05958.1 sugar kinase [Tropicibacter oceani]
MRFLAIGECMAEFAPTSAPNEYSLGFAGDTFNTAWYLARMWPDIAVSYFTAVGDDAISGQMCETFSASGIDHRHVQRLPGRTVGLYMITLDKGERSFSYWRGQSAARHLADDPAALNAAIEAADLIYFSGITLAILDAPARENLLNALQAARAGGHTVAFDPNLRPRLWSDPAQMTDAIMRGAAVSDIALPSFEDEAQWFQDANPEATAERYAAAGASTIVVKNGGDPVFFRQGQDCGSYPVPGLSGVVDTTAAGDSFNAAILAGIKGDIPLRDSVEQACQLAGQVVQGKGALVPVAPFPTGR